MVGVSCALHSIPIKRPGWRRAWSTWQDSGLEQDFDKPIITKFGARPSTSVFRKAPWVSGSLRTTDFPKSDLDAPIDPGGTLPDWLECALSAHIDKCKASPVLRLNWKNQKDVMPSDFPELWRSFRRPLFEAEKAEQRHDRIIASQPGSAVRPPEDDNLFTHLKRLHKTGRPLGARIKYAFEGHVINSRFDHGEQELHKKAADLRFPSEWYPNARQRQRIIHLHVGPTNSGKTYHALKRLEQAKTGAYAGPLRLLAHEVYTRMNANGARCMLVTGEERRRAPEDATSNHELVSCTVEMVPLNTQMDVAVIDEIQMINNSVRGWAWLQAFLGVQASEVHLCGEARTEPFIRELCATIGERLEIHRYARLSPLKMDQKSLNGDLRQLRKGDCIVSFSVMGIHALRTEIKKITGRNAAVVYGSLPPETRSQQANLFNDPTNDYDFLVASDAIGMGLNLAIKRIIFEKTFKFDGLAERPLSVADIKQIAGRAGRYRVANQSPLQNQNTADTGASIDPGLTAGESTSHSDPGETVGIVTTLEDFEFPVVSSAMKKEPEPIKFAYIEPPDWVLERFAMYFPQSTPFSFIINQLYEICLLHPRYRLCRLADKIAIADLVEPIKGLTIADRAKFCVAPLTARNKRMWMKLVPAFARAVVGARSGDLLKMPELDLDLLDAEASASRKYLSELETLHHGIAAYLWLSYRFAGVFTSRTLAFHVKSLVELKIEKVFEGFSFSRAKRQAAVELRKQRIMEAPELSMSASDEHETDKDDIPVAPEKTDAQNASESSRDEWIAESEPADESSQGLGVASDHDGFSTAENDVGETSDQDVEQQTPTERNAKGVEAMQPT